MSSTSEPLHGQSLQASLTVKDLDKSIARRITATGGVLDTEPTDMPWGARICRVRDPDEFKWTISKAPHVS